MSVYIPIRVKCSRCSEKLEAEIPVDRIKTEIDSVPGTGGAYVDLQWVKEVEKWEYVRYSDDMVCPECAKGLKDYEKGRY